MALRTKIRTSLRIRGSLSDDCIKGSLMPCCIAMQIENELNKQGI